MARKGQFQPGQSGNPKGRPPKERALSDQLEKAGGRTFEIDGKRISGKRLLPQIMWELLVFGRVELPENEEGKRVILRVNSTREWLDIAKQIYAQVDGPPKSTVDLNTDGAAINVTIRQRDGD